MPTDPQEPQTDDADELAAVRAAREAQGLNPDGTTPTGQSIEDIEADGGLIEEDDGQVAFVYERGRKVTFGSLIKRGTSIEYHVKFGGKSVKGRGEPLPLEEKDIVLAGHFVMGGYNIDTVRDDEDNVTKVKVYAKLKPKFYVDPASSEGKALLGTSSLLKAVEALREDGLEDSAIKAEFTAALEHKPAEAA